MIIKNSILLLSFAIRYYETNEFPKSFLDDLAARGLEDLKPKPYIRWEFKIHHSYNNGFTEYGPGQRFCRGIV